MTEDWPVRPADTLFYAQEKAELEHLLAEEGRAQPHLSTYLLRPPIVLGPDAVGAKARVPAILEPLLGGIGAGLRRLPALPVPAVDMPIQLIHHDDVAEALRLCVIGAGPPGAYNIAADGVVTGVDVVRELGLRPVRVPAAPLATVAGLTARLPFLPSRAQWVEALSHPAVMDTAKAKAELGWRPTYTAIECLRATLPGTQPTG
jgi:nucleoside-diphosphate-sugar epimerase